MHVESFLHSVASPFHSFVTTMLDSNNRQFSGILPSAPPDRLFCLRLRSRLCKSAKALEPSNLAGVGIRQALPFRSAMGLEAHTFLARLQDRWLTMKGLHDSPDDTAEWARRKPDGKILRRQPSTTSTPMRWQRPPGCASCNARGSRERASSQA